MDASVQGLPYMIFYLVHYHFNMLNLSRLQISIPLARVINVSLKRECFLLSGNRQTSHHYFKRIREISQRIIGQWI